MGLDFRILQHSAGQRVSLFPFLFHSSFSFLYPSLSYIYLLCLNSLCSCIVVPVTAATVSMIPFSSCSPASQARVRPSFFVFCNPSVASCIGWRFLFVYGL